MKTIKISLFLLLLSCLVSCGQLKTNNSLNYDRFANSTASVAASTNLKEVAPPKIIKELNRDLEQYIPQVQEIYQYSATTNYS